MTPRITISSGRPFPAKFLCPLLVILLLLLSRNLPAEVASELSDDPAGDENTCFTQVWDNAHDHPWFLDENGREVVPEVRHDWLIVHFSAPEVTEQTAADFYERYSEAFEERLAILDEDATSAVYRLRQGLPSPLFQDLLQRWAKDPQVHSIQPVWRIEQRFHIPLNQIEVTWKAAGDRASRQRLLSRVEALQQITEKGPHTDLLTIDPCRRAAWQIAALLSEELLIVDARPLILPILPPLSVEFRLDPPGAMAGMPMPFSLTIRFVEGISIETATIANLNLAPTGIFHNLYTVRFDHPPSAIDLSSSPIQITGTLEIYATGDYELPALPVFYTDRRNGKSRPATLYTESQALRIASLVPEKASVYKLQVPSPRALPQLKKTVLRGQLRWAALLGTGGLLCLASAAVLFFKNRLRDSDDNSGSERLQHRQFQTALAASLKGDPETWQATDWTELGRSLRTVLSSYAGTSTTHSGGSYRSFLGRLKSFLSPEQLMLAETVLGGIEQMLATDQTDSEQRRALVTDAEILLNSLKAVEPRPSAAEER